MTLTPGVDALRQQIKRGGERTGAALHFAPMTLFDTISHR